MKLYLVRHGETDWNVAKKLQGQSNTELNERGIALAKKSSLGMQDIPFFAIYSSPLNRAYKTAEILRGNRPIPIWTDERMKEISFGKEEGVQPELRRPEFMRFFNDPANYEPAEGGETYEQLLARGKSFLEEVLVPLSLKEPQGTVLLTAHGAWNRAFILNLTHQDVSHMWDGPFMENLCTYIFEINGKDYTLLEANRYYYERD